MPGAVRLAKVGHIHETLINEMLLNPQITKKELATAFGYTEGWISRVTRSDAFMARLEERRRQLIDPQVKAQLNKRLEAATMQACEQIQRRLDAGDNADLALQALAPLAAASGLTRPSNKKPK